MIIRWRQWIIIIIIIPTIHPPNSANNYYCFSSPLAVLRDGFAITKQVYRCTGIHLFDSHRRSLYWRAYTLQKSRDDPAEKANVLWAIRPRPRWINSPSCDPSEQIYLEINITWVSYCSPRRSPLMGIRRRRKPWFNYLYDQRPI